MNISLEDLGPAVRAQAEAALKRQERERKARQRQQLASTQLEEIYRRDKGSRLEDQYYMENIWPKELAGLVANVERHKRFELLPKSEYCGLCLPAAHYTPDFVIEYTNGMTEVVEVKHEAIRKNQRDYIYRRRLFIELIAKPKGWVFKEYIKRDERKKKT